MEIAEWVAEAQQRADAATPGPWAILWDEQVVTDWEGRADDFGHLPSGGYRFGHHIAAVGDEDDERSDNEDGDSEPIFDVTFIAHARTDLPRALAALRAVLAACDGADLQDGQDGTPPGRAHVTTGELRDAIASALG